MIDTIPKTRIVIQDDVRGTRRETVSPFSPEEVIEADGDVQFALWYSKHFSDEVAFLFGDGSFSDRPAQVAIFQRTDSIVVHWYVADGTTEDARRALAEALEERRGQV